MGQVFHPSTNTIARLSIYGAAGGVVLLAWVTWQIVHSPYVTQAGLARTQPVPFSHKHHVADAGIDCRYCHAAVEDSSFADIPSTKTCLTCHSILWKDAEMLEPVRASGRTDRSLEWVRVHDLPDHVYFDHAIHVQKGIGCATCHGRVDRMPLTWREHSLYMRWCLDCHRHPENFIRPRAEVFNMDWEPPADQAARGARLIAAYHVRTSILTDCTTCHR